MEQQYQNSNANNNLQVAQQPSVNENARQAYQLDNQENKNRGSAAGNYAPQTSDFSPMILKGGNPRPAMHRGRIVEMNDPKLGVGGNE